MKLLYKLLICLVFALPAISIAETNSVLCLAKNIYHEARGEPLAGKLAIAKVTLNRTNSEDFPSSVCGVVYEKGQFSWTANRGLKVQDKDAWQESLTVARIAISSGLTNFNFPALYFHNTSVKPHWNRKRIAKIGNHVFYK